MHPQHVAIVGIVALTIVGCTPAASTGSGGPGQPEASSSGKVLNIAVASEPASLAIVPLLTEGASFAGLGTVKFVHNADLALRDENYVIRPQLAESVPQLNTDSWSVTSDGRMETTWKLKPGLVWHDGTALSAQDFVFAWGVYKTPDFGQSGLPVMQSIQDVTAPDERTLLIQYRQPFQLANFNPIPALPRQVLEKPFASLDPLSFSGLGYWTREYVGLGPYRVDRWEPGSFIEGAAFPQYVLGRPRIERIKVMFILDENTAIASLRAGEVHFAGDSVIRLENSLTLKDWILSGAGRLHMRTTQYRAVGFQFRPELVNPPALRDVRVRKALAHTVDRQLLNDTIYEGLMTPSDFLMSSGSEWAPAIESSVVKYPYDVRRAEQLMNDAGFVKDSEGLFAGPDGRLTATLETANQIDRPATAMSSNWRSLGYAINDRALPSALTTDPAARVTYPAMSIWTTSQGENSLRGFTTSQCARAENGWRTGSNRGCWSDPEYDRLFTAFNTTLDPQERGPHLAQMAKLYTDQLAMISVLFLAQPYEVSSQIQGVLPTNPEGDIYSNIHEWQLK